MYVIDISPDAWTQLGGVPTPVYEGIRTALDAIAARGPLPVSKDGERKRLPIAIAVEDWIVVYEEDPDRLTLRVITVARRAPVP